MIIYETLLMRYLMHENVILYVSRITLILMENRKEQKLPSVTIDNKLNFKSHISELCTKPSQKSAALSTLSSYLHNSEKKINFQFHNKITI